MTLTLKNCTARILTRFRTYKQAYAVFAAVRPEIVKLDRSQVGASIRLDVNTLVFEAKSDNLAALRASVNSYLRLADASYRCLKA